MENTVHNKSIFTNTNEKIKLNSDAIYKPLRSYLLYVVIRTFKSLSTIIILCLTLAASLILSLLPNFFSELQKPIVIFITPMMLVTVLVTLSATFGVAKSLDLFVGFQAEGTELIIVSKPISRTQILIVKFSFLFVLGLVYCSLITGFCAIGFAVVGFAEYAESNITVGGVFLSTLLAYMIMGLLAIAISIISDTSDKIAKTVPNLILSISLATSFVVPQLITATNQNPTTEQVTRFVTNVASGASKAGLTYGGNEVFAITPSITSSTSMPFSYDKSNSSIFLSSSFLVTLSVIPSGPKPITISYRDFSTKKPADNLDDRKKIFKYLTETALNEFKSSGLHTTGIGWTAFTYLNPISAFMSISGTSITTSMNNTGLPFNYSFADFSENTEEFTSDNGLYTFPSSIKVGKAVQADPQWALAVMWASMWIGLGVYTVWGYQRKDFK